MTDFLENSFSLNNNISISNKIKKIPFFFNYFNPIDHFKNLDNKYKVLPNTGSKSNIIQGRIKYKIINYMDNDFQLFMFTSNNFLISLYHIFFSLQILNNNNIVFVINNNPTTNSHNTFPCLNDFSYSFNFSIINSNNIKLFFPISLLENKYIPFDVFIIIFLINNNIDTFDTKYAKIITEQYTTSRENIDKNKLLTILEYFNNHNHNKIINYLLQFKHTWSYYSFCYYFICNYNQLLSDNTSLLESFYLYINSGFNERNNDLINDINNIVFHIVK